MVLVEMYSDAQIFFHSRNHWGLASGASDIHFHIPFDRFYDVCTILMDKSLVQYTLATDNW